MKNLKQITIQVPIEIHQEIKINAAKYNMSMKEYVIDSVKAKNLLTKEDGSPKKKLNDKEFKELKQIFKNKN